MKTSNPLAGYVRSRQGQVNWIVFVATTVAFVMTTGLCSASDIGVTCALPPVVEQVTSCVGQYKVSINTSNTDSNATVTAEILGLDQNGKLLKTFMVQNGDTVELGSRLPPPDWEFKQTSNLTEVIAPVPLLHVTVQDQGQTAEAFCSNIPYVEVLQPTGGVVSESNGTNTTNVFAAVPATNPQSLQLNLDGVNILSQVPNFLNCTPNAPCSGSASINGNNVNYSNLAVDIAETIDAPASNTVKATLSNLSCGGHIFNVSTKEGTIASLTSRLCDVDSLNKTGTSSVFEISITNPTPGMITPTVPTPVAGQVCSGTQITDVNINGKDLPVTGETFTKGNGTTTGDVYLVPINTTLDQTDLVRDAFETHDAPLGTFDPGSNRLAASATDINGNRTYQNLIFATGAVAPVAVDPNAVIFQSEAMRNALNSQLKNLVNEKIEKAGAKIAQAMDPPTNTDLPNAFVVGLTAAGAQTMFNKLCTAPVQSADPSINGLTPGQIFSQAVTTAIEQIPLPGSNGVPQLSISSPCSCNPPVNITLQSVNVGTDVTCNLTFNNGYFHVTMGLPDVSVVADAIGYCEETFLGACTDGAAVGVQGSASVTGIELDFDVTEADLLNNTVSPPVFATGTTTLGANTDIENPFGGTGISFCGISEVCKVLVEIFTFGAVNLTPTINISQINNFSAQIGASQPDPVKLHQIKVDPTVVANFQQNESGDLSSVTITPNGITAGLVGHFSSLAYDPTVPATPGVHLTPAPVPTLPVPNADSLFVGISDDAINMFFATLTAAGRLQTGTPGGNSCINTGVTVGDLLPADCDTLTVANDDIATVAERGYCHAIKGDNCATLSFNDPAASVSDNANLTASEQGECYGAQGVPAGQTCASLTGSVAGGNLFFLAACSITPYYNLQADQPLLFCARGDVPPRMLFPDTPGTGTAVPAVLRIPSLSVALIIDRDPSQVIGNGGAFGDIPGCFAQNTPTGVDCNVFSACLDLNLNFSMNFETCSDGNPGFASAFQEVQVLDRQVGTVCGGPTSPTTDSSVLAQGSNTTITIPLGNNGAQFAPPICGAGLNLGGFVQCTSPEILSIRSEFTDPTSRDYLAISCAVQ